MYRISLLIFAALSCLGFGVRIAHAQSDQSVSPLNSPNTIVGNGVSGSLDVSALWMNSPDQPVGPGDVSKQGDNWRSGHSDAEEPEDADYRSKKEYEAAAKDEVARKTEFGERPIDNTRAFLRSQTPFVPQGKWQFDFGAAYSVFESDLPFISGTTLTEINAKRRILYTPVGLRYGITERLQWFGSTLVGLQRTEVSDGFTEQTRDTNGIGDCLTGFNYLLRRESTDCPSIIGSCDVTIPTGNTVDPRALLDSGLGIGAWSLSSRLLMVKSLDPVVAFWGVGYRFIFEDTYNDQRVNIGDQIQYTFGVGFAVNEKVTLSCAMIGSYITDFTVNSATIPGSNADLISLRMASTVSTRRGITEPFVALGLTDQSPAASVGITWTR